MLFKMYHETSTEISSLDSTSDPSDIKLKIEVDRVNYHNTENGWSAIKAHNLADGESFSAVGHFHQIYPGEFYIIYGIWTAHKDFGKQFKILRSTSTRPHTKLGIIKYLSSGLFKGVGEKTAAKIVKHCGLETFNILDNDPERIKLIPGLGKKNAAKIISSWKEQSQSSELTMFLNHHGISSRFAQKLIKLYGCDTMNLICDNPYRLIKDVRGIGFVSADKIARSVGIPLDDQQRIKEAIKYQLEQAEDFGHCFLTTGQLIQELESTLQMKSAEIVALVKEPLLALNEDNTVVSTPYSKKEQESLLASRQLSDKVTESELEDTSSHYIHEIALAEAGVAHSLARLHQEQSYHLSEDKTQTLDRIQNWLDRYCDKSSISLSSDQSEAVVKAALNKVFILTGGPGVGKTTTANTIIKLLRAMGKTVGLCAPTGRAAQRLSQVSSLPAKTIHRLLEWSPTERRFLRDHLNPLNSQVILVDEASMLDIRMAYSLFQSIPNSSQLILIGDVDQLPSVGPGNVLKDLIHSQQVACQKLMTVFRQAQKSEIIQAAHQINAGKPPVFSNSDGSDCRFIACKGIEEIKTAIKDLLTTHLPKAGYNPVEQIQILTPMNKGDLGNLAINNEIQELLNPKKDDSPEYKRKNIILRAKDKVIQNVNNYDLSVFNGDIGTVIQTKVEGGKILIRFGDRDVYYDEEQAQDLNLAYSITIHKSQGSEFPVVIIPMSMNHYIMHQRNLIYTALTRARKLAIFVGEARAIHYAVKNISSAYRQTRLCEKIQKNIKEFDA